MVLADYSEDTFTFEGKTRRVFRRGSGPAVVVIAEVPGITPKVVEFADRVVDLGCTAVLPNLFGEPGIKPTPLNEFATLAWGCVNREFAVWSTGRTSPITEWLRALGRHEHETCGGPGIGAVGMCFTGGFALAMATDERMLAPVLSQPSMPLALTTRAKRSIDISPADLDIVKRRCAAEGLQVLGLRFRGDRLVPRERFEYLAEQLGDAFVAVEIDDDAANPDAAMSPHSVLTEHLVDAPGEPTRAALDTVLDPFRTKLLAPVGD
jgi:dienelactone hydrolase